MEFLQKKLGIAVNQLAQDLLTLTGAGNGNIVIILVNIQYFVH